MSQTKTNQTEITPAQAIETLKEGNIRFIAGKSHHRDLRQEVKDTAHAAFPFAAIVGCMDSRVSDEFIFDQGIGDIFSLRIAGNFINDDILGNLEFTCVSGGAKLVVVVGHTECNAMKAACDDVVSLGNFIHTLSNLKPAVAAVPGFDGDRSSANSAFVTAVTAKNVELALQRIRRRSTILEEMENAGDIAIAGALYDVHTGVATFLP